MPAHEAPINDFGLIIAYVLPGLLVLHGAGYFFPSIHQLMEPSALQPSVAGFLLVTLISIGFGLMASTVRWLLLDTLHHRTGVVPKSWDFSKLQKNVAAFDLLVSYQYRYYQFYGNALIALIWWWVVRGAKLGFFNGGLGMINVFVLLGCVLLFLGSRDTLRKYYQRKSHVLSGTDAGTGSLTA